MFSCDYASCKNSYWIFFFKQNLEVVCIQYCSFPGERKRKKNKIKITLVLQTRYIVFALQAASGGQHKYLILPHSISVSCLQCLCSHACSKISSNKGVYALSVFKRDGLRAIVDTWIRI